MLIKQSSIQTKVAYRNIVDQYITTDRGNISLRDQYHICVPVDASSSLYMPNSELWQACLGDKFGIKPASPLYKLLNGVECVYYNMKEFKSATTVIALQHTSEYRPKEFNNIYNYNKIPEDFDKNLYDILQSILQDKVDEISFIKSLNFYFISTSICTYLVCQLKSNLDIKTFPKIILTLLDSFIKRDIQFAGNYFTSCSILEMVYMPGTNPNMLTDPQILIHYNAQELLNYGVQDFLEQANISTLERNQILGGCNDVVTPITYVIGICKLIPKRVTCYVDKSNYLDLLYYNALRGTAINNYRGFIQVPSYYHIYNNLAFLSQTESILSLLTELGVSQQLRDYLPQC